MLTSLSIRDIVLIDKLDLGFDQGLTVLTGETGAGKSILLDSLGLATGARAVRALVRQGQKQGSVSAEFTLSQDHEICTLLDDQGVDHGDGIIVVRRQITTDGRSRAWLNDQPVGQALLSQIGEQLLEVHGQHDDRSLLEPGAHRALLDAFGGYDKELATVKKAHKSLQVSKKKLAQMEADLEAVQQDEEYILHAQEELAALNPVAGEEGELSQQRTLMMQGEKLSEDLDSYHSELSGRNGVDSVLRGVLRRMERTEGGAAELVMPVIQALDRASIELADGIETLEGLMRDINFDPQDLEAIEERLFEIRRLARKHNCQPDDLASISERFEGQAQALSKGEELVAEARRELKEAETAMEAAVEKLSKKREQAAKKLDKQVTAELPPLKLEKAIFRTLIEPLDRTEWNQLGGERITFEVKTNPSTPFGPMVKVASGGELARFILALKVVLAEGGAAPVMVFDEVDKGIGGATASAVGERLKRLSKNAQILVVTHSPQVAACGDVQFQISKADQKGETRTSVAELTNSERREEIARMLAGAEITDAARAAADQLLDTDG